MSEEHQQQKQQPQPQRCHTHNGLLTTVRHEASAEDNFAAMRNAAMSMFKQRTKDLTMVSSLTAEADELEQLNSQVQSTINQLQEQKAVLEAQIETEESRVKERELQLREVHTMLAQMQEDQGVFSGVHISSEHVAALLQQFVTTYTAKGGDVVRLLERAQDRAQGRSPNEWRAAANDLRWRQSVTEDHIKQIERQHTIPAGFADILLEWSRGVWRQHSEYVPLLHLCEELLLVMQDATETVRGLLPPPVFCELTPISGDMNDDGNGAMEANDDGAVAVSAATQACAYSDVSLRNLNCIAELGTSMEKEGEAVGLCCAVLPRDRLEQARSQCNSLQTLAVALQKANAVSNDLAGKWEEQRGLVEILKERVSHLDTQRMNIELNLQKEVVTILNEVDMHENLCFSWYKALQTAATHKQHETTYQSVICTNECVTVRLETELDAKTLQMREQFLNLHTKLAELYPAYFAEEKQKEEALRALKEATDVQNEDDVRFCSIRDICAELETVLQRDFEEMRQNHLGDLTDVSEVLEYSVGDADPSKTAAVDVLLKKLLLCDWERKGTEKDEDGNGISNNNNSSSTHIDPKDEAENEVLETTGLHVEFLQRVVHCLRSVRDETEQTRQAYQEWKHQTEEELLVLTA